MYEHRLDQKHWLRNVYKLIDLPHVSVLRPSAESASGKLTIAKVVSIQLGALCYI